MRDTGFGMVAVRPGLVKKQDMLNRYKIVYLLDSTPRRYQIAHVDIDCRYFSGSTEVIIVNNLVTDCVLGNINGTSDSFEKIWENEDNTNKLEMGEKTRRMSGKDKDRRHRNTRQMRKYDMQEVTGGVDEASLMFSTKLRGMEIVHHQLQHDNMSGENSMHG